MRKSEVPMPMGGASPCARGDKPAVDYPLVVLLAHWPTGRRIAVSAGFCLCIAVLIITLFQGISDSFLLRGVQTVAIAIAAIGLIGMVVSAITGRLADYTDPADEEEFEELVRRSERL